MSIEIFATICFGLALIHTFSVKKLQHFALMYPEGSVGENLFHLLGEIEVVFGIWALVFLCYLGFSDGVKASIDYLEAQNFTEPLFVFVIMAVCSTRPILNIAFKYIALTSKLIPLKGQAPFYFTCLTVGPLLGSFITEPAAMTVTALILLERFYKQGISLKFKYATLGLLFVNISIGGTLTPYAAPPVLMVASKWNWDLAYMFTHFGWKAVIAVICSTLMITYRYRDELKKIGASTERKKEIKIPTWVSMIHLLFLAVIVLASHHAVVFVGIFLFFLGLTAVTREYQSEIKLREGLLVGFFLGGLVVLGGPQRWWLEPILSQLDAASLYFGGMALTAITDNAALTFLGSQVPTLSETAKYALVAGSVVGGGLTVIANAPNPAGYGILNSSLGKEGISPLQLFLNALPPTLISALCFWFLK